MALHTQRWTPDTCTGSPCVFLEEWDDSVDPVARTHIFKEREHACSRHATISDGAACFLANVSDNHIKNTTWTIIVSVKATYLLSQFIWSFRADGVLLVNTGSNLTTNQKTQAQSFCDVQFGAGKVIIS